MIITKKALPRRTFLRGMRATLALPLLDAMVPAATALDRTPAKPVPRLGFVFIPMGCDHSRWTPGGGPLLDELSPHPRPAGERQAGPGRLHELRPEERLPRHALDLERRIPECGIR